MSTSYTFTVESSAYKILFQPIPATGGYSICLSCDIPSKDYLGVFFTIVRLIKDFMEATPGFTKLVFRATGVGNIPDTQKSAFFTHIGNRVAQQTGKIQLLPLSGDEVVFLKIINLND